MTDSWRTQSSCQSMGENTVAAVLEFGRVLASGDVPTSTAAHGDGYVAFDLAGLKMVSDWLVVVRSEGGGARSHCLLPSALSISFH